MLISYPLFFVSEQSEQSEQNLKNRMNACFRRSDICKNRSDKPRFVPTVIHNLPGFSVSMGAVMGEYSVGINVKIQRGNILLRPIVHEKLIL